MSVSHSPRTLSHSWGTEAEGEGLPQGLGEFDVARSWALGVGPRTPHPADSGPTPAWPPGARSGWRLRRSTEGLMTELPRAEATPPPGTKRFQILLRVALSVPLIRSIHPEPVSFFLCMPALGGREPAPGAPRGHPGPPPAPDRAGLPGRGWTPGLATRSLCQVGLGRMVGGRGEEAEDGWGSSALHPQRRPGKPGAQQVNEALHGAPCRLLPTALEAPCEGHLSLIFGCGGLQGCGPWMGGSPSQSTIQAP